MNHIQSELIASLFDVSTLNLMKKSISELSKSDIKNGKWSHGDIYFYVALITSMISYYSLYPAMSNIGEGRANLNWNIISSSLGIITGYYIWNEKFTSKNIMGIVLGIVSLYLLNGN